MPYSDPTTASPVPVMTAAAAAGTMIGVGAMPGIEMATPATPSRDYAVMSSYWRMVCTILDGAEAMRAAGTRYLPQFPAEETLDYAYRLRNAKFTNIYEDIVEGLAAKPFAKELQVENASSSIMDLIEDIDGQGNHIHVFSASLFFQGINDGITWILVDKPALPARVSIADERAAGARPYWVAIPAMRLLAVESKREGGVEIIVHARIYEPTCVRVGYKEEYRERVREFNRYLDPVTDRYLPAEWVLWEKQKSPVTNYETWTPIDRGTISIGVIALVPFLTGRRKESTWQIVPPMKNVAELQVEHFQQESNLKCTKEAACFPILSGNGVKPQTDAHGQQAQVAVGPRSVLFAPPNGDKPGGSWSYVEPAATSLTFLANDIKNLEMQMREIGRQPLTANTGNLTVVTTAFAAAKGNSAVQAWALNLKDAVEAALKYTAMWLNDTSEPEVKIYTDFSVDLETDNAPDFLLKLRQAREISRKALISEAQRRDLLSPEYDEAADAEEIANEAPPEPSIEDVIGALGGGGGNPPGGQ